MELIVKKPQSEKLTNQEIKQIIEEYANDILWCDDIQEYMDNIRIEFYKRGMNQKVSS